MIIRYKTDHCFLTGRCIDDQKVKQYQDKEFIEITVNVNSDKEDNFPLINITVWRKMFPFKKGDHVFAGGKLKTIKKDDKTYYSMNADFIIREEVVCDAPSKPARKLTSIDDDSLLF